MANGSEASGSVSSLLHGVASELIDREHVSLEELAHRFGQSGFGLALITLALPAMIPIPGPFGMVMGCCLMLVALQMMAGSRRLTFPSFVGDRRLTAAGVKAVILRALPWVTRIEQILGQGRWRSLTAPSCHVVLGVPVLLLAFVLALPIPFGNIAPVASLLVIGLSLVARDGLVLMVGLLLTLATFLWTVVLIFAGARIVAYFSSFLV